MLSPLLFIMYTDSCRTAQENKFLLKFSNDIVLLSLLQGSESDHGPALPEFVKWCDENYLDLSVSKTKDMIIDFRHNTEHEISVIHGEDVEIVDSHKYFGAMFDSKLKFDLNTELIVRWGQQRIYLLRKLSSFHVRERILTNFYCSFIESLLTFSFICWFNSLSIKDKNRLHSIVKTCSKIIGVKQRDLGSLWESQVVRKARNIISQPLHVLFPKFSLSPSGCPYPSLSGQQLCS